MKPPCSFWSTTPSGVPRRIVETGMCARRATAAACCGVTRPAVWPPSEIRTTTAGGRFPFTVPWTVEPTRTARAAASASAVPCGPAFARASAVRDQ